MWEKRYFFGALLLPLVVPFCLFLFGTTNAVTAIFFSSLWFAGIPYLVFILLIMFFLKKHEVLQIRKVSYFAPIIFVPLQLTAWAVYLHYVGQLDASTFVKSALPLVTYDLIVGYFYVAIINFVYVILRRFRKPDLK